MDPVAHPTRPPTGGIRRLETSREGRRVANVAALILVCCATALAACAAWALFLFSRLYPLDIKWLLYFSLTFPVLSQLWAAYSLYLPAHTVLEFSPVSLRLTRSLPVREWSGPLCAVRTAYFYRGVLAIRTTERVWHGWAIKVAPSDAPLVEELKRRLGPGVWLDGRQGRLYFVGRQVLVHAILLAVTLIGGRLVNHIERAFH